MILREFFTYTADGFEQYKTYNPENDISVLDKDDTRKTRLKLSDINQMRLASEDQKMYGQPAQDDNLQL